MRLQGLKVLWLAIMPLTHGCVTAVESDVHAADAPNEDVEYEPALQAATVSRNLYKDFEARYAVAATYLSPAFRNAFTKRLTRVYKKDQVQFEEAKTKAGFFVSVQMPGEGYTDLENPQHWTVQMETKSGSIRPILVKKLLDKERWRAFFPAVSQWSADYLVIFDAPSVDANSPELVAKTSVSLSLANADGQVVLAW